MTLPHHRTRRGPPPATSSGHPLPKFMAEWPPGLPELAAVLGGLPQHPLDRWSLDDLLAQFDRAPEHVLRILAEEISEADARIRGRSPNFYQEQRLQRPRFEELALMIRAVIEADDALAAVCADRFGHMSRAQRRTWLDQTLADVEGRKRGPRKKLCRPTRHASNPPSARR